MTIKYEIHFGVAGDVDHQGRLEINGSNRTANKTACEIARVLGKRVDDMSYFLVDRNMPRIQWDSPNGNFVQVRIMTWE